MDHDRVHKKSKDPFHNLEGEIYWYQNIPHPICQYFPKLITFDKNQFMEYTMTRIDGETLSHLYVNQKMNDHMLQKLFAVLENIHKQAWDIPLEQLNKHDIYANYSPKIRDRMKFYEKHESLFPGALQKCKELVQYFDRYTHLRKGAYAVVHADPVFTNVLYCKNDEFMFVDMKGKLGKQSSIIGDKFYDWAKVYQSLLGYDSILLDQSVPVDYKTKLLSVFHKYITYEYSADILRQIQKITQSLILTLIPLHYSLENENKCKQYASLITE
jgi:hypothetical protein